MPEPLVEPDLIIAEANAALGAADATPEAILRSVVDAVTRVRPAIWVTTLITKHPAVMRVIGHAGSHPVIARYFGALQGRGGLASGSISTGVIESGEPLFLPTVSVPDFIEHHMDEPVAAHDRQVPGELSGLVVPMRARNAVVGTLGIYVAGPDEKVGEDDVRWLQVIADETGLVIENARLREEAKHRIEMVTTFDELAFAVASSHDLSMVLNIVVDRIRAIFGVDACDLLLLDQENNTFEFAASAGFGSTMSAGVRLKIDDALLRQALDSRRIEYLGSASVLDQVGRRSMFMREGFEAYAAWPVVSRGELLGALEVFHRSDLSLEAESMAFIACLAALTAVAVRVVSRREGILAGQAGAAVRRPHLSPDLDLKDSQILRLLVDGQSNREIAAEVHLSVNTIKSRVRRLLDRSGVVNRTELARRATREGWV